MGHITPSPDSPMERARRLMERKDNIEAEIDAQFSILKSQSCTMATELTDSQGFPRADMDVYAVRLARVRIIELRNDLKKIIDNLHESLQTIHSTPEVMVPPAQLQSEAQSEAADDVRPRPFARVDGIMPGSPAAAAGLQREDLLLQFGNLNSSSFTGSSLQPLAEFVPRHENRSVEVKVQRGSETVTLNFVPRTGWGGRGMLGCHVVPLSS